MELLLKYTYLLDSAGLKNSLNALWSRYLEILEKPSWEDLNEARAILYIIGFVFPEEIATEAINRRLHLLKKPLTDLEFYQIIDSNDQEEIDNRKDDELFMKMASYYKVVKEFKNKTNKGQWYLDEDKFVDLYNQFAPDETMKLGRFGEFKHE